MNKRDFIFKYRNRNWPDFNRALVHRGSKTSKESLQVVIKAIRKGDLPADDVITCCAGMVKKDFVGFICDKELCALHNRFSTSGS